MKITIRAHNVEVTAALRDHVERRLGFALGRFGAQVERALVRFSETTGGRGGLDRRCQIEVGLQPRVRVEDTQADTFAAVDGAAHRAARAVSHALERSRDWELATSTWRTSS